ncbi:MAG: DUF4116 domain-containing protein [Candidatus Riflemargulisbacteria bacterium]
MSNDIINKASAQVLNYFKVAENHLDKDLTHISKAEVKAAAEKTQGTLGGDFLLSMMDSKTKLYQVITKIETEGRFNDGEISMRDLNALARGTSYSGVKLKEDVYTEIKKTFGDIENDLISLKSKSSFSYNRSGIFGDIYQLSSFHNREFVIDALLKNSDAYYLVGEELKNDIDISVIHKYGKIITDKQKAIDAITENPLRIDCCNEVLRGNKDVILVAAKNNEDAWQYASDQLKNDKDVVLATIEKMLPTTIKTDKTYISLNKMNYDEKTSNALSSGHYIKRFCYSNRGVGIHDQRITLMNSQRKAYQFNTHELKEVVGYNLKDENFIVGLETKTDNIESIFIINFNEGPPKKLNDKDAEEFLKSKGLPITIERQKKPDNINLQT